MKKGGGKSKGSSFERELCTQLSLWISGGKRSDLLWRSAMSGGRATVRAKKGEKIRTQAGDISAVDPLGHVLTDKYYIEAKHYKNLNLDAFLLRGGGPIRQFWDRAVEEAARYDKTPMLICRQDRYPTFVLLPLPRHLRGPLDKVQALIVGPEIKCMVLLFEVLLTSDPPSQMV